MDREEDRYKVYYHVQSKGSEVARRQNILQMLLPLPLFTLEPFKVPSSDVWVSIYSNSSLLLFHVLISFSYSTPVMATIIKKKNKAGKQPSIRGFLRKKRRSTPIYISSDPVLPEPESEVTLAVDGSDSEHELESESEIKMDRTFTWVNFLFVILHGFVKY